MSWSKSSISILRFLGLRCRIPPHKPRSPKKREDKDGIISELSPSEITYLIKTYKIIPIKRKVPYEKLIPNFEDNFVRYFGDLTEYIAIWLQNIFAEVVNSIPEDNPNKRTTLEFLWSHYKPQLFAADNIRYKFLGKEVQDILEFPH